MFVLTFFGVEIVRFLSKCASCFHKSKQISELCSFDIMMSYCYLGIYWLANCNAHICACVFLKILDKMT